MSFFFGFERFSGFGLFFFSDYYHHYYIDDDDNDVIAEKASRNQTTIRSPS